MILPQKVWRECDRRPRAYFACALAIVTLAAVAIRHGRPLQIPLRQFTLGAQQILATHHIQSTFLPLGYSAFLGYVELIFRSLGPPDLFVFAAQVGVLNLVLVFSRSILQNFTSARFATTVALIVTLDPVLLFNANRITDADITLALLLSFVASLFKLSKSHSLWTSCFTGAALAAAVLVRPNMLLLALLLLVVVCRDRIQKSSILVMSACFVAVGLYVAFTIAIHGSLFLPQNGPYNVYAGFNPRTKEALLREVNGEASIVPAMRDAGLHATLDWGRQSDLPGIDDSRDERYIPFYKSATRQFIWEQPRKAVWLLFLKLFTFLRPVHEIVDQSSTAFRILRSLVKIITLLPLFVWIIVLVYGLVAHSHFMNPILLGTAVLYTVPFVFINADPRFRTALEAVVYLDLARMFYSWRQRACLVQ